MFINTMAVGPFEPWLFCVTGGTTVAIGRACFVICAGSARLVMFKMVIVAVIWKKSGNVGTRGLEGRNHHARYYLPNVRTCMTTI
jgi:hypothetical protein